MNLASIYLLFKIIKEHVIVIEINIMIVLDVFKSNFNYDGIAQQFKKNPTTMLSNYAKPDLFDTM